MSDVTSLTTHDFQVLDDACGPIHVAFKTPPYLVGSAARGEPYRDVDVRLILDVDEFNVICGSRVRWELLSDALGAYLRERTNLPIDFQIQRIDVANERHTATAYRNPLGMGRIFAAGGDATPWSKTDGTRAEAAKP